MTNVNKEKKIGIIDAFKLGLKTPRAEHEKRHPEPAKKEKKNLFGGTPGKEGHYKLGDTLSEGTRSAIYGFGILFLVLGVIVGIAGIIATIAAPFSPLSWWWLSPMLFVIGIIMKLVGTKIDGVNNNNNNNDNGGDSIESSRLEHKPY